METGVAKVTFRAGDAVFTRETFVSYPDRVVVVRVSSDKPGRVSVRATLKSPYQDAVKFEHGRLALDGTWKGPIPIKECVDCAGRGKGFGLRRG